MHPAALAFTLVLAQSPAPPHTDPSDPPAPPAPQPGEPAPSASAPAPSAPASAAAPPAALADLPPPCGDDPCEDGPLLAAWLRFERALAEPDLRARDLAVASAIHELGALHDARAVPLLLRLSNSRDAPVRLPALSALGAHVGRGDPRALARLREVFSRAQPGDLEVALPALLAWSEAHPGAPSAPCPEGAACVDDARLLAALLAYTAATVEQRPQRVSELAALADPRALDLLVRVSFDDDPAARGAAIDGLAMQVTHMRARARLLDVLVDVDAADRVRAIAGLGAVRDPAITDALFAQRRIESDDAARKALEAELTKRAPDAMAALLEEERLAALAKANEPDVFDTTMRGLLSAGAGVSGAIGGAAASAVAADAVSPGFGMCFGAWGACAGGASAAAVTWFALGDRRLGGSDVALAASTTIAGGFAGLLVPPTIGAGATKDVRHMVYAASGGALVGLAGGTIGALLTHPTGNDVAELDFTILGAELVTAGALLSFAEGDDARPFFGSLIGATLVGTAGGALAARFLDVDALGLVHTGLLMGAGFGAGLFAGGARQAWVDEGNAAHVMGAGLLGAALGTSAGLALGHAQLAPTPAGMVYETWAGLDYALAGAGAGLLVGTLVDRPLQCSLTGTAIGAVAGVASTAAFRDGVAQDYGDLMLQPIVTLFALYHGGLLVGLASEDAELGGAAALLAPAAASAAVVYAAPYVRAGVGDVLMISSMMGAGAYLSAMALLSVDAHTSGDVPAWGYVLGTSLAMDAGLAAGIALDLVDDDVIDSVGWRTAYVLAVAAGSTLVVSLPGALLASIPGSPVAVPDVLLASTLLGVGVGLLTMPLIDFRIAPDFGLGKRPDAPANDAGPLAHVQIAPTIVALAPLKDESAQLGLGVGGRF